MTGSNFQQFDFENQMRLEVFIMNDLNRLFGERLIYKRLVDLLCLKGDELVLDFGGGSGISTRTIAKQLNHGGCVTWLDTSRFWCMKAKQNLVEFKNVKFFNHDLSEMNENEQFDVIFSNYVIHDIHPAQRPLIFKKLAELLKPGGCFFINDPTKISHGIPVA